ncbi:hypothetical protein ACH5RR_005058 [Cinchona calisaya]|uniref:hAT-like transposase RNase-H fold domain-containing protein n=1 Tax=Cinchona calisaya TaxID=153742 RepID=A0ABD3AZB0_9GENT
MRCAAHILSLTMKEGLKDLDDSIVRIKCAVKYMRSSPARAQRFKSCIEKERIDSKSDVCLDVETRWNSTYLMLESAVKFQKAFELLETADSKHVEELTPNVRAVRNSEGEMIESMTDKRDSRIRGLPSEFDWDYACNLLPFLKVFYDTTLRLSGSLYVTGNPYMVEIYAIGFFLIRLMAGSDENLAAMASRMKKKHDKYWANVDKINVLLFIAVVLDPRFKLRYVHWVIEKTYNAKSAHFLKEKVNTVLKNMFDIYNAKSPPKVVDLTQATEMSNNEIRNLLGAAVDYMNSMHFDEED